MPPVANPPSKQALLLLMKQARAFGLGVVLATQNPIDIDYKGLSNAGTWFLGRLQTERDKARLLDGLEGALAGPGGAFDRAETERMLSSLQKRTFFLHNVHEDAPVIFQTRWAMSYLRGPLTQGADSASWPALPPRPLPPLTRGLTAPWGHGRRRPGAVTCPGDVACSARASAVVARRARCRRGVRRRRSCRRRSSSSSRRRTPGPRRSPTSRCSSPRRASGSSTRSAGRRHARGHAARALRSRRGGRRLGVGRGRRPRAPTISRPRRPARPRSARCRRRRPRPSSYAAWLKDFARTLQQNEALSLLADEPTGLFSHVDETEAAFRARVQLADREARDAQTEKLRQKYAPKVAAADRAQARAPSSSSRASRKQASESKLQTGLSIGATIFGALLGRKTLSASTLGKATTAARGVGPDHASVAGRQPRLAERREATPASSPTSRTTSRPTSPASKPAPPRRPVRSRPSRSARRRPTSRRNGWCWCGEPRAQKRRGAGGTRRR